ncbi:MAG: hypothetical protein ACOC6F_00935 [bacterium]
MKTGSLKAGASARQERVGHRDVGSPKVPFDEQNEVHLGQLRHRPLLDGTFDA